MDDQGMDRLRDIEMRLFAEIGNQLKTLSDSFREFTDKMNTQMQDVRERLTRIEASNGNESDRSDRLEGVVKELTNAHNNVDRRLLRLETIIVPVTTIGAILASAVVTTLVDKFLH